MKGKLEDKKIVRKNIISFQGVPGAYSQMACYSKFGNIETLPCQSFEEMITSVQEGRNKGAQQAQENFLIKSRLFRFMILV